MTLENFIYPHDIYKNYKHCL